MTGRVDTLATCRDGGGTGTGVLRGTVFFAGLGRGIAAVDGEMDADKPGLPLEALMPIPRPIPVVRMGVLARGRTQGFIVWGSFCGIRHIGAAVTRGMVMVLAGGTVVLTAIGAMVVGCLTGTDTVSEDGLAAIGALAVGCLV